MTTELTVCMDPGSRSPGQVRARLAGMTTPSGSSLRRGCGAAGLGDPRGLGERRDVLLRIAGAAPAGLDHARGHDQFRRLLDRNVELDDLAARHIEEEPGG